MERCDEVGGPGGWNPCAKASAVCRLMTYLITPVPYISLLVIHHEFVTKLTVSNYHNWDGATEKWAVTTTSRGMIIQPGTIHVGLPGSLPMVSQPK